jgi:ADP-ribose pyrophosphatase
MPKPFIRHGSELLLTTPIFKLRKDEAEHPETGHRGSYYILENPDWVNIVALTEAGEMLMVRQWRHGTGRIELELPAGMVEPGEAPEAAAARELLEETGYAAAKLTRLGEVAPNAAYQQNRCYSILAEGCRLVGGTSFDPGEDIEIALMRPAEVRAKLGNEIMNALGLCALFWWFDRQGRIDWPTTGL